jgi:hypothetical protein
MTHSEAEDIVIEGAELDCDINIKRGTTAYTVCVKAYPTKWTRDTTNKTKDGKLLNQTEALRCQWVTPGIFEFHVDPRSKKIYEASQQVRTLCITIDRIFHDGQKQKLVQRAEKLYGSPFTVDNFKLCQFKTFVAKLTMNLFGVTTHYYGILKQSNLLTPLRIHFEIKEEDPWNEIERQLGDANNHDIHLELMYGLAGVTMNESSLEITAEQTKKTDLLQKLFGNSHAEKVAIHRSKLDKIVVQVANRLSFSEKVGINAKPIDPDLIKREILNAIVTQSLETIKSEDIYKMRESGTLLFYDDLKADVVNEVENEQHRHLATSEHTLEESSKARSSEKLQEKSSSSHTAGSESSKASEKRGGKLEAGVEVCKAELDLHKEGSSERTSANDQTGSSALKSNTKKSASSSEKNDNSESRDESETSKSRIQGTFSQAKSFDVAIINRNQIVHGFYISFRKWQEQLANVCITDFLSTRGNIQTGVEYQLQIQSAEEEKVKLKQITEQISSYEKRLMAFEKQIEQKIQPLCKQIEKMEASQNQMQTSITTLKKGRTNEYKVLFNDEFDCEKSRLYNKNCLWHILRAVGKFR